MEVLAVPKSMWGVVSSIATLGGIVSSLILLRLERTNISLMATCGSIGVVTNILLFALPYFTKSYVLELLALASLIGSISSNILGSSISAMLTLILPVEVRGRAIGIQRILDNIGASIASIIAGLLYTSLGPGQALVISGLLGLVSTMYLYALVRGK
jgi:sugar phosphate permease